ncbi:MAG: RidA family protein [Beijerinckiaceae bacterium]
MSKRINIHADDIPAHVNPIPAAAMIGNVMVTSAVAGIDVATGKYLKDKEEQIALAFRHLRRVLELAHLTPDDVVRLTLYFADRNDRPIANKHWLELFPDEHSRPARLALISELPDSCALQIDCMAVKG